MSYETNKDLPKSVKNHLNMLNHRNAFNHAYDEYKDARKRYTNESFRRSHRVACFAAKAKYEKNSNGNCHIMIIV